MFKKSFFFIAAFVLLVLPVKAGAEEMEDASLSIEFEDEMPMDGKQMIQIWYTDEDGDVEDVTNDEDLEIMTSGALSMDEDGNIWGTEVGSGKLMVEYEDVIAEADIDITEPKAEYLIIRMPRGDVNVNERVQIEVEAILDNGLRKWINMSYEGTMRTSTPEIIKVVENGDIIGLSEGEATIMVQHDDLIEKADFPVTKVNMQ
ncbi:hypothetical protein LC040_04055 [Bacillus tianshenii]|nr:hypothetical protein LC040_04055 [Bacillus tianshenii]